MSSECAASCRTCKSGQTRAPPPPPPRPCRRPCPLRPRSRRAASPANHDRAMAGCARARSVLPMEGQKVVRVPAYDDESVRRAAVRDAVWRGCAVRSRVASTAHVSMVSASATGWHGADCSIPGKPDVFLTTSALREAGGAAGARRYQGRQGGERHGVTSHPRGRKYTRPNSPSPNRSRSSSTACRRPTQR